jgi:hypothetical protein
MSHGVDMSWLNQATAGPSVPAYLPAVIGLVCGFVLLLAGGKVLRPVAILLGGAGGALGGSTLLTGVLPESLYGVSGQWVGLGIGVVVGMVAAAVLFRAAMAAAGAVTFGAAGVLACAIWMGGLPQATPTVVDNTVQNVVLVSMTSQVGSDGSALGQAAQSVWGDAQGAWASLSPDARLRLIASGLGAGMLGLLIGALMPRKAAALLTALLGSGVFLASLCWVTHVGDLPGRELLEHGPTAWLAIWAVVAGAGLVFQLSGQVKPKPRPAAA